MRNENIIEKSQAAEQIKSLEEASRFRFMGDDTAILAAIVQSSEDAIISKGLDGIITSWNASAERIFGYTAEEMIGSSITRLIPHDRPDEEAEIIRKLCKGERIDHFQTKRIGKFNRVLDVALTISPIKDSSGAIIGASKIARDISEQKATERLMRENEERFRMAMESTKLGPWDFDCSTGVLTWSQECKNIYQLPADIKVDYALFSSLIHPDDSKFVQQAIEQTMSAGSNGNYNIEFRILHYGDGAVRWIRAQGKMYFSKEGMPERFIGTALDITDEKAAKELLENTVAERTRELVKANKQLEESNNELEQFAYIASHDLQEPLRKIQTYSNLLYSHFDDKKNAEKYFEKIGAAANRMSRLISDVLNYSRLSGEEIEPVEVDLNMVLTDVLNDYEMLIEEKKVIIHSSDLPVITGNSPQIHQLFANLISNAIKFSREHPQIDISAHTLLPFEVIKKNKELRPAEKYIELSFRDNGIGFEQHHANQIFVIFQRLNNRQKYTGTGIGLALCQKIVQNHGGFIYAESEPGKGAEFKVVLPFS